MPDESDSLYLTEVMKLDYYDDLILLKFSNEDSIRIEKIFLHNIYKKKEIIVFRGSSYIVKSFTTKIKFYGSQLIKFDVEEKNLLFELKYDYYETLDFKLDDELLIKQYKRNQKLKILLD